MTNEIETDLMNRRWPKAARPEGAVTRGAGAMSQGVQSAIGVALLLLIFGIVTLRALLS